MRIKAPNGKSNSFYLLLDGKLIRNPYTAIVSKTFAWQSLTLLEQSENCVLEFRHREAGTLLDVIYVTANGAL